MTKLISVLFLLICICPSHVFVENLLEYFCATNFIPGPFLLICICPSRVSSPSDLSSRLSPKLFKTPKEEMTNSCQKSGFFFIFSFRKLSTIHIFKNVLFRYAKEQKELHEEMKTHYSKLQRKRWRIQLLEFPIPTPTTTPTTPTASQKATSGDISGTKRGIIDPLSKRPEKFWIKKL